MLFKTFMREGFMPLPVALISCISANGIRNIAPYSCIMPVLRPLMMTGTRKGMNFCTVTDIGAFEPFGAMFPGGKDPLAETYRDYQPHPDPSGEVQST